jgi:hypothetical protein
MGRPKKADRMQCQWSLLPPSQQRFLSALVELGEATVQEISPVRAVRQAHAPLLKTRHIERVRERKCSVTGNPATTYRIICPPGGVDS